MPRADGSGNPFPILIGKDCNVQPVTRPKKLSLLQYFFYSKPNVFYQWERVLAHILANAECVFPFLREHGVFFDRDADVAVVANAASVPTSVRLRQR